MAKSKKNKVRYQLRFTGRVQGVGFRYTANSIAQELGITGWVMNDWDGSVLMEAQGTDAEIEMMIDRLGTGVFIEIDNVDRTPLSVIETEQSFRVRY
mgnify:CR=1 FL=1